MVSRAILVLSSRGFGGRPEIGLKNSLHSPILLILLFFFFILTFSKTIIFSMEKEILSM